MSQQIVSKEKKEVEGHSKEREKKKGQKREWKGKEK